jgi:hypothetical protein
MTMATKDELLKYLKSYNVGDTPTVTAEAMSKIFDVLSRGTVEAWLSDAAPGFVVKYDGSGQSTPWVFQRRS